MSEGRMDGRKPMPLWQLLLITVIFWILCAAKIAQMALYPSSRRLPDGLLLAAWLIIAFGLTRRTAGTIRQWRAGERETKEDAP